MYKTSKAMKEVKKRSLRRFLIAFVIIAISGAVNLFTGGIETPFWWFAGVLLATQVLFSVDQYFTVRKHLKEVRDA